MTVLRGQAQFGKPTVSDKPGYRGPAGMPMFDRSTVRVGSRGGAAIWVMREAFMPRGITSPERIARLKARRLERTLTAFEEAELMQHDPDKDGFAVFGRYPKGFIDHILRHQWLGAATRRDDILHVCSGTLSDSEKWTVDLRAEARPAVRASGTALPFAAGAFPAIMIDPPYSDQYARDLYGVENPRPSWLLKEAARVVRPGGRIGLLHVAVPFPPPACHLVNCYGVTTGVGYRIRAFTVFERSQESLFTEASV
jgi:hypothetical protein